MERLAETAAERTGTGYYKYWDEDHTLQAQEERQQIYMRIGILGERLIRFTTDTCFSQKPHASRFSMDKVLIMPAGDPYFKRESGVSADRTGQ